MYCGKGTESRLARQREYRHYSQLILRKFPAMANKQETKPLEITVPLALYEHLTALASQSHLGATESTVAVALIVAQIDERERSGLAKMSLSRIPTLLKAEDVGAQTSRRSRQRGD